MLKSKHSLTHTHAHFHSKCQETFQANVNAKILCFALKWPTEQKRPRCFHHSDSRYHSQYRRQCITSKDSSSCSISIHFAARTLLSPLSSSVVVPQVTESFSRVPKDRHGPCDQCPRTGLVATQELQSHACIQPHTVWGAVPSGAVPQT